MKRIPDKVIVEAVKASARSNMRFRMGAVIYNRLGIISTGFNKSLHCGPSEFLPRANYSIHAEEDCLFGISRRLLFGSSIFIYRSNNNLAKPCAKCAKALAKAGITKIYYSPI
jgi:deoxycytidylate deaminase